MKKLPLLFALLALCVLSITGCGGNSNPVLPPGQTAQLSVTVTDTPPAGVTVLSFEVTVNAASLNSGSSSVALISKPVHIEVKQLETESAFLSTTGVTPGTYQSITLSLVNPELTILNQSAAPIAGCAVNAVCELKPTAAGNVTFSSAPFPITLSAGSPTGLQVDVNVASLVTNSLTVDFSVPGAVTVAQLPLPGHPMDHLDDLDDLKGTVQNLDATAKTFTLHTTSADFPITTDTNTQFEFKSCLAGNFSCLANGQIVQVEAKILAGGVFLAKEIEFEDNAVDDELEGIIFKVDDSTHFEIVVLEELRDIANVSVGNPVIITLDPSCAQSSCFRVQAENLSGMMGMGSNSTLQQNFESALDTSQLLTGQAVELRLVGAVNPGPPVTATANRIRLRMTQFTARVKAGSIAPPNFSVVNLPSLFTGATPPITEIHVQTSPSMTTFMGQGATSISSLSGGDTVSLRGLLFRNGVNPPELLAKKVRKR